MKIITETSIENFEAWSGGRDTLNRVIEEGKCNVLEAILEDLYPDGMTDTQLNDLLWFDSESVYEWCGISEEDEEDEEEEYEEETIATEELEKAKDAEDFETYCNCFSDCEHCPYNDRATTAEGCEILWNEEYKK